MPSCFAQQYVSVLTLSSFFVTLSYFRTYREMNHHNENVDWFRSIQPKKAPPTPPVRLVFELKFYFLCYRQQILKLHKSNVNNDLQSHLANVLTFSKEMGSNGMTAFYWTVIIVLLIIFWYGQYIDYNQVDYLV